jgi:hypothetical protein
MRFSGAGGAVVPAVVVVTLSVGTAGKGRVVVVDADPTVVLVVTTVVVVGGSAMVVVVE